MKPIKTLVLVADDAKARLFENVGPGKGLREIEDLSVSLVIDEGMEYADRAGRRSGARGLAQHGVGDLAEAERDQARAAFVKAVLAETQERFRDGGFERFVMTAAPATLGLLRAALPDALKAVLTVEMAKDFVKLDARALAERLSEKVLV